MRCATLCTTLVISSAGICRCKVRSAHRKHRRAAVTTEKYTRIEIIVLLYTTIMTCGTLLFKLMCLCENLIINNSNVIFLKNNMLRLVIFDVLAVDVFTLVLTLTKCTNIKVIFKYGLYCNYAPFIFYSMLVLLAFSFFAFLFNSSRSRNIKLGKIIRNLLVAPAVNVKLINSFYNFSSRLINSKAHSLAVCYNVTIRH